MERTPVPSAGLQLPDSLGISPKEETKIAHRWETLEGVIDTLNKWGFGEAVSPKVECPVITAELLLTPDIRQYTVLYSAQLHWYNYANILKARVEAELLQLDNEMDDIGANIRKSLRDKEKALDSKKRMSVSAVEDEVLTDGRYRALKIRAQELKQFKMELGARVEELETGMKVISRQVEIRKEEAQSGTNMQNMAGRSNGTYRFRE